MTPDKKLAIFDRLPMRSSPSSSSSSSSSSSPSPMKKQKKSPIKKVKLPVRVIYGTIGDEKLILAAVYVNAYHIKQAFIDNTHFRMTYSSITDRMDGFQFSQMEEIPKELAEASGMWIANGFTRDVEELKINSAKIQLIINEIQETYDGAVVVTDQGEEVAHSFITDEVVAEDVLQLGLISLIEYEREKERRRLIKIPVPANTRIVNGSTPLRRV
jgi:hypothetical protein